jgi:large subunit ribosomal protein L17
MVTSLFKHQRILTTDAKAKELRRWADHLVSLAKRGDLHARRQAMAIVREKNVVHKLFEEAQSRFSAIAGGYTRVVKLGRRAGDAAPISVIELVTPSADAGKTKKKTVKMKAAVTDKKTVEEKAAVDKKGTDTPSEAMPVEEETRTTAEPEEKSEKQAGDQPVAEATPQAAETKAADDKNEAPEQSIESPLSDTEKK